MNITKHGLLEWFLTQNLFCYGYSKMWFPNTYFAQILSHIKRYYRFIKCFWV